MSRIYVPSASPESWRPLLAQPDLHWKPGYSAMSLARAWQATPDRLPAEIDGLLASASDPVFVERRLVLAIPEHTVPLPGGSRATQTDVFAFVQLRGAHVAMAVEGKVDEEFGPTVAAKASEGAEARLAYLHDLLRLHPADTGALRYQLFHRTAAAIVLANEFGAAHAAMVVHSFSPTSRWYDDFSAFVSALGAVPSKGQLLTVGERGGAILHLGWASGDQRFRSEAAI